MGSLRDFVRRQSLGWLNRNAVILDTETTGLDDTAQVVELAVIDCRGEVLIDTLVKPRMVPGSSLLVPTAASNIHGITDEMLIDAPRWEDIHKEFCQAIYGRELVIYNSAYDTKIINQTAGLAGINDPLQWAFRIDCAMLAYAKYRGKWNEYKRGYRWHKLTEAAEYEGIDTANVTAHRAYGDCLMTLELIKAMAAEEDAA